MLIVLMLITILLSWVIFSIVPLKVQTDKHLFITQLQADLYKIQSYSIHHEVTVILTFYPLSNKYVARTLSGEIVVSRKVFSAIEFDQAGTLKEIVFFSSGNTNRFGSVHFRTEDILIKLTFQIGQGRFYVQEF